MRSDALRWAAVLGLALAAGLRGRRQMPVDFKVPALVAASAALVLLCSCGRQNQEAVPAGPPMAESIRFTFAVYPLPSFSKDPLEVLRRSVAGGREELKIVSALPEAPRDLLVRAAVEQDVQNGYPPADLESLRYTGRGLSEEQAEALQKSQQVLILEFAHPKQKVWEALRAAHRLAAEVAAETGGVLYDAETRETFTPAAWRDRRPDSWPGGAPDVSRHITIHLYQDGELVRAVTLGMAKLGLPDVVVEDFAWSSKRSVGHLINLFCQAMAEGAVIGDNGAFDLNLRAIRHPEVREPQLAALRGGATGIGQLSLRQGAWEEGDPSNRLIEITPDRYEGRDVHARLDHLLSSLLGSDDAIVPTDQTAEVLAASRRAKARLPALRAAFAAGLRPGEYIQVKAPFRTPDGGREWMWVVVTSWRGSAIEGLLDNEPFNVPDLQAGQRVEVDQAEVFDYIRHLPDGTEEGNETGRILERMEKEGTEPHP